MSELNANADARLQNEPANNAQRRRGRLLRRGLFLLGAAAALLVAGYLFLLSGRYIATDNAYVKAAVVNVGAEVSGKVSTVAVAENEAVAAGQLLVELDARPYRVAVRHAQAKLAEARLRIASFKATYAQHESELAAAHDDLVYSRKQHRRLTDLHARGAVSQAEVERSQLAVDAAASHADELRGKLAETRARLAGDPAIAIEQHPAWLSARADYDAARLDLERTAIRAPIEGIASKVPNPGDYATPGLPLLTVVGARHLWIEANFKEDQLARMRAGKAVEIEIDSYPGRRWHGVVDSIGQATGAEFALLPPQNATGNWVKVVQRIPVRIRFAALPSDLVLRAGMSATVTVDTGAAPRLARLTAWLRPASAADKEANAGVAAR